MLYLIEYDRRAGEIVSFAAFSNGRVQAEDAALELELRLNAEGSDHEVVLLDAENERALRRSHRRYFETTATLTEAPGG